MQFLSLILEELSQFITYREKCGMYKSTNINYSVLFFNFDMIWLDNSEFRIKIPIS